MGGVLLRRPNGHRRQHVLPARLWQASCQQAIVSKLLATKSLSHEPHYVFCIQNRHNPLYMLDKCSVAWVAPRGDVPMTFEETASSTPPRGEARPRRLPIRRRLLHAEVGDRLRDMIAQGEIGAGSRLNEQRLAEMLDVSRTPIREALKQLASEGLVELLPGRGARVARLAPEAIIELFEVISGIERHAVELASLRMTQRELARLQALHERMVEHYRRGQRPDYFRLNQEIHLGLVAAARNPTLKATHAALMAKAGGSRYTALMSPERWVEAVEEHETLMQALALRDPARAGEIMLQHVRRTGEVASAALRDETRRIARTTSWAPKGKSAAD